jgi:CRP/FNR family transcriptional regulator, cyclic AMP receptor protein
VLGEVAFFDGQPRSADVIAATVAHIAELTPENLLELAQHRPRLATAALLDLGRILAQRLRRREEDSQWNRRS